MEAERPQPLSFPAHVVLVKVFLAQRDEAAEKIQELLNAQRKPAHYLQDSVALSRQLDGVFNASRAYGELRAAHRDNCFRPRDMPGVHNDLVDPAQMMIRAFHLWQRTRWPGRNVRLHYAQTLFNLYVVRYLELLSMRVWDAGPGEASARLFAVQQLLDQLWTSSPAGQPVIVRDARWLIPLAQSPTNEELGPYFEVAEHIAGSFSAEERLGLYEASVVTAGGHLRSQLRHYTIKNGVDLEENGLVLTSRSTNALDFALLIQGLVPLLAAYERACTNGDADRRRPLAGTILQGLSVDPDLFVNRLELLGAYSEVEHLFVTPGPGNRMILTPMGQRHAQLLEDYQRLIVRSATALLEDCPAFQPREGRYSPYGLVYGFSSNLTEHMAFKALQPDSVTRFSLEDVFVAGAADAEKLEWVSGWRKLPHIEPAIQQLFDYPQAFAEAIFARIERALRRRVVVSESGAAVSNGRLHLSPAQVPDLSPAYVASSDLERVSSQTAHFVDETQLLFDRKEGAFLISFATPGGWVAITKDLLTQELGAGRDMKLPGLPDEAREALHLLYPALIAR